MLPSKLMIIAACLGLLPAAMTGGPGDAAPEPETIALPRPRTTGGMAVTDAIAQRRSDRTFADTPLTSAQIAQLCWAAQGITDPGRGFRTAPSAGALYPAAVYVVDARGIFQYLPREHALRRVVDGDTRKALQAAALDQEMVGEAPACMVITLNVSRTAAKYGPRARRYCLIEAGHIAQNVLLQATDLGLVGVPVGAFDDEQVAAILKLPGLVSPAYLLPLGHPR
jgi:SagB-type dehydrogenase family enzyme